MYRRLLRWLYPLLGFIALALLWQASVEIFEIRPYLLPSITAVAESAWEFRNEILSNSLITSVQIIYGFGAAVIGGIIIGLLVFFFEPLNRIVMPVVILVGGAVVAS